VEVSLIGFKILAHITGNENLDSSQRFWDTEHLKASPPFPAHRLIDDRPQAEDKKIYLYSDLLPAHELGMALRQPDTALQQPHRGSGLQQKKKYFSVYVTYF
jgi:hypothetical protein